MKDRRRKGHEKHTERVEVRLGPSLRNRFLETCKRAGETPSDVLRAAMSDYVVQAELAERKTLRQEFSMKLIHNPLKAASMTLASLTAFVLMAAPSSADERLFNALDFDGDGAISVSDLNETDQIVITVLDTDRSQTVTLDEFRLITQFGRFTPAGPVEIKASEVIVDEDDRHMTFDGRVDLDRDEKAGFELRLPPTETWDPTEFGLETLEEGAGAVDIQFGDIRHVNIVTLDLSEAAQVRLTSERLAWEDFDAQKVGLLIMDPSPEATPAP